MPAGRIRAHQRPPGHFGVHLMLDGYGGSAPALADREAVLAWLERMPDDLGMRRLTDPFLIEVDEQNPKDPGGLSGFVLIAESHLSVHTFPERGFLSADVYTCQPELDPEPIRDGLISSFGLADVESQMVLRGTRYAATCPDPYSANASERDTVAIAEPVGGAR